MDGLLVLLTGLLGLAIGSFLNVVIWRVPRKVSVVRPPSHCPHCENPIPVRYPLVEAGNGVLFAAVAARFGATWELPAYLVLTAALLAISIIDLEHFIVPDRI